MAFEYIFTALPPLPREPGGKVELAASELAAMCGGEDEGVRLLTRCILMEFDIRAIERMRAGGTPGETALFSDGELREGGRLPTWLVGSLAESGELAAGEYDFDRVWRAYFAELMRTAESCGSAFLARWVAFDAGLRFAIAAHRAAELKGHVPTCERGEPCYGSPYSYRRVIDELIAWEERGETSWRDRDRFVAQTRLAMVRDMSCDYAFDLNELLAYIVRFTVLKQSMYLS